MSTQGFRLVLCKHCHHPGGQHVLDGACRLCVECPKWEAGNWGSWTDSQTTILVAKMREEAGR